MKPYRGILLALTAGLFAVTTAFADVAIELELADTAFGLGEPFDVTIRLKNIGSTAVVTREDALSVSMLWPYLEVMRLLPDGTEVRLVSDRPLLSPPPTSLWVGRDGVQVAAGPALVIEPGASVEIRIVNLLWYLPIVDPWSYQLSLVLELPTYSETFTDPAFGETLLVALYDHEALATATASTEFSVALGDGLTDKDVEWFRESRELLLRASSVDDAVEGFATLVGVPPTYVHACSSYWIGEAYQLYGQGDRAIDAYERVLSDHPESLFARYAENRVEEILGAE